MDIAIVICTYRRGPILAETLESIATLDPAPTDILVVDGDPDESASAYATDAGARYLTTQNGLTRQRNVALGAVNADVVLFLDDDVAVQSDLIARLRRAYADESVVGACGKVVEPDPRRFGAKTARIRRRLLGGMQGTFTRVGYPRYVLDVDTSMDVEVMQGCYMSARLAAARQIGFDDAVPGWIAGEDEDFSYRLSRLGRIRYLADAVVVHRKTGFLSADGRAFGRNVVRFRWYLYRKNFRPSPVATMRFVGLILVLIAHRVVNREWSGARGLLEGLAELARA
jgi:GT2 family glycosyltransferase